MRRLAWSLGIAAATQFLISAPASGQHCAETGRLFTQWFLAGKVDSLWERLSPEMRKAVHGMEGLTAMSAQVRDQAGRQVEVLSETCETGNLYQTYTRLSRFERRPGPITIQWTWDGPGGTVVKGFVRPTPEPAPSKYLDYQTKTKLRLPFQGDWYVFWGGRTLEDNYHIVAQDQRFAYDFVQRKSGASHTGDGKANEQYYCFGQAILAPAAGKVISAVDSLPDNKPGSRDLEHPFGNHVELDHGNGGKGNTEFSVLAHLQHGSVRVRPGQTVAAGDTLGLCGNSGNSSEPHLHVHVQDGGWPGQGDGLPAFFTNYAADGAAVARGEPKRGQVVAPR
jgi:peptidase M23-like protein